MVEFNEPVVFAPITTYLVFPGSMQKFPVIESILTSLWHVLKGIQVIKV